MTGGDSIHHKNDPLWRDDSVLYLLKHRSKMTAEEMRHARAGYNHKQYAKKIDPYKKIKEDLQLKVTANQMTEEEYERIVLEETEESQGWVVWYRSFS